MSVSSYFRTLAVAAGLATLIIVTVMMAEPAKAAFPGTNGKIAFDSVLPGQADSEIVTVTHNPATGAVQDEPTPAHQQRGE